MYVYISNDPVSGIDLLGLVDTLTPGPHANRSIPASGPGIRPEDRPPINDIGRQDGCHTCGEKDPKTKSGNFVPDHQPPSALVKPGQPQKLYPQCLPCSQKQGGEVTTALRAQRAKAAKAVGAGVALLVLEAGANAMDNIIAKQDQKKFNNALAVCQRKAAEAGLDDGCGCCVIGTLRKWSNPASPPNWFDRLAGIKIGQGPSGSSVIWNVTGTFYKKPCDEVYDPGVLVDGSTTYESRKISF